MCLKAIIPCSKDDATTMFSARGATRGPPTSTVDAAIAAQNVVLPEPRAKDKAAS